MLSVQEREHRALLSLSLFYACSDSTWFSPACFSLSGVRRGAHPQFSNFREDKENIPHDDDDDDGPILYRDDDTMEEEGELF